MSDLLNNFELYLQGFFATAPFSVSFLAGILTFFLPCVLPMVPAYLSYISGLSINDLKTQNKTQSLKVLFSSLLFMLGFGVVFVAMGVLSEGFGDILRSNYTKIIGGIIIIIFGLHIMQVIKISFLNMQTNANFKGSGVFSPFVLGLSFALGWSPCVGPILASIFLMSAQETGKAGLLMATYALGLGVPFVLAALATNKALGIMTNLKKHFKIIEIIAGILLIAIGLSMVYSGASVWMR